MSTAVLYIRYELRNYAAPWRYERVIRAIQALCNNDYTHVPESGWFVSVPASWTPGQVESHLWPYVNPGDSLMVINPIQVAWRGLTLDNNDWLRGHLTALDYMEIFGAVYGPNPPIPAPKPTLAELVMVMQPPKPE